MHLLRLALQLLAVLMIPSMLFADCKCDAPKGSTLRCYSINERSLSPPGRSKFSIVDHTGCKVGYTEAILSNTFTERWVTKDGKLEIEFTEDNALLSTFAIQDAVDAFPEAAAYVISNPDAQVWVFTGNHHKDDPNVLSWKAKGDFKKCDYVEVRCAFVVLNLDTVPYFKQCLGCHWFFNNTNL